MILRILLFIAAYNAGTDESKNQNEPNQNGLTIPQCVVGTCGVLGICAIVYGVVLSWEAQQNYDKGAIGQNNIVPSNCNLSYNQNNQLCLTIASVGYAMGNAVQKCFPNMLHKIRACLSSNGNNYATGITKDCTEEDLKEIRLENQKIMDVIKQKTNFQPSPSLQFPTGYKILHNHFGYTFKNPSKDSKSGCLDMNQTPRLSESHCGKYAEMQLLARGNNDFWSWAGTDWEITFNMLNKQNPLNNFNIIMKKETTAWANRLYEDFMNNMDLNLFKRRTYSIFVNGHPIAQMNVQYLDGEKWYGVCKSRSRREYLSWSEKCDINRFFSSFNGYIDVPVRVEIEANTPQGRTTFRSMSKFDRGILSSSAHSGVFQCNNNFSGSWYNHDVNQGCSLVLNSNKGFEWSASGNWPKLTVAHDGVDPLALLNLHASEYYTSKIEQDWKRQYYKDKRIVEEREEKERERKREIERKREERERERENRRHQSNPQSQRYQQNQRYQSRPNNKAHKRGPIQMTKEEEEYVKRQNQGYRKNY